VISRPDLVQMRAGSGTWLERDRFAHDAGKRPRSHRNNLNARKLTTVRRG